MKRYNVKVNGKVYEVELESVETVSKSEPVQKPVDAQRHTVVAPMQGTILKSLIQKGATVTKGTKLFILEAMKLENEILAPSDGVVKDLLVTQGQAVDLNQPLLILG